MPFLIAMQNQKDLATKVLMGWTLSTTYVKAESLTSKSSQFFAGWAAFFGMFTVNELGIIFGMVLGAASFALSWYFKRKNSLILQQIAERQSDNPEIAERLLDEVNS